MTTNHGNHRPTKLYPVVATLLPNGSVLPYPDDRTDNDELGEHITGKMTMQQFNHLTGIDDIKPFLGCILYGQEGPFVYQARHVLEDLVDATNYWNTYRKSSLIPIHEMPDDVDDISDIMNNMMDCLTTDTLSVDDDMTVGHLQSLKPEELSIMFQDAA